LTDDYYVAQLDRETHVRDLQALYDRCPEFVQIEWGSPSNPEAAEQDFKYRGLLIYGIYSRQSELIGVLEMLRDYPKPEEWWLALLMFDARARNRGLGARVCASTLEWIAQQGGRAVWLGAQENNLDAQRFWSRMGFVEKERQPYVASNGHESRIVLMKREVADARPATSSLAISFASKRSPSS